MNYFTADDSYEISSLISAPKKTKFENIYLTLYLLSSADNFSKFFGTLIRKKVILKKNKGKKVEK